MTRTEWKHVHRAQRILRRMALEQCDDVLLYGCAFQKVDETGVYNIPPWDVYRADGIWTEK